MNLWSVYLAVDPSLADLTVNFPGMGLFVVDHNGCGHGGYYDFVHCWSHPRFCKYLGQESHCECYGSACHRSHRSTYSVPCHRSRVYAPYASKFRGTRCYKSSRCGSGIVNPVDLISRGWLIFEILILNLVCLANMYLVDRITVVWAEVALINLVTIG